MSKFDDYLAAAKTVLARSAKMGVRTELRAEAVRHFTQRDAMRDYPPATIS